MTWEIFVGLTVIFAFMIAVITPIIKLYEAITKLSCSIDAINQRFDENQSVNNKRLEKHGQEIDEIKELAQKNEREIAAVKERVEFLHR